MENKLSDYSFSSVIPSIEGSLREFWENWGSAPRSDLYDSPNLTRLYTGVPYAFCNGVICSHFSPDNIDAVIDETISYYSARNATWEWIVGPNTNPDYLGLLLEKHGLITRGASIGMAINLHAMNPDIPSVDKLRITQVDDNETLQIWANTMVEGFETSALYPTFVDLECSLGHHQQSYYRYLGSMDQQPVATCALFLGEKVAGIYCVSTVPKARRLGIGASMTQYALRNAQRMGYHIAVLHSSPMGRSVYRQLGFKEFSTLQCYIPAK